MILVTGATGHVGSELVRQLTAAGHPVRAMTRRPPEARLPAGTEAAQKAGVRRVVKLSVLDGGAGADLVARWQAAAESRVTAPSRGFTWTLLHPGRFMANALQWAGQLKTGDEIAMPFTGRPAASIDPAEIAAPTLTDDEHAGMAYELSGPQSLTPAGDPAGRSPSRNPRITRGRCRRTPR